MNFLIDNAVVCRRPNCSITYLYFCALTTTQFGQCNLQSVCVMTILILNRSFDLTCYRYIQFESKLTSTHSREPMSPASSAPQAQNISVLLGRQPAQRMRKLTAVAAAWLTYLTTRRKVFVANSLQIPASPWHSMTFTMTLTFDYFILNQCNQPTFDLCLTDQFHQFL